MSNGDRTKPPAPPRPKAKATLAPMPESPGRQRAAQLSPMERAQPTRFMQARAHLAATLTGASTQELGAEVAASRAKVNTWQSTAGQPITTEQGADVLATTLGNDYTVLKRFQSEAAHSTPRQGTDKSAVDQVRALHGGRYRGDPDEAADAEPDHFGAAIIGARHTKGFNDSPFVSLAADPSKLLVSADDGQAGAKTIAHKAAELHTYTVPKAFTWTPERLRGAISNDTDFLNAPIMGNDGSSFGEWLRGTPTQETEVLFHGGDLAKYRTEQSRNPYLPPLKPKKRRGKRR